MQYDTAKNRSISEQRSSTNLNVLLRQRYKFIGEHIDQGDRVLEVGAGIGITQRFLPTVDLCTTDVEANPWIDAVASGEQLPFKDAQFDAVICIAALHHMDYPLKALRERERVLKPGGKALIVEARASWTMRLALALTGHEYIDHAMDPFGPASCQTRAGNNWDGNNAIGDALFSDLSRLKTALPGFQMIHCRHREFLLFLNSGGVNHKTPHVPLPETVLNWIGQLDGILCKAAPNIFPLIQEIVLHRRSGEKDLTQ